MLLSSNQTPRSEPEPGQGSVEPVIDDATIQVLKDSYLVVALLFCMREVNYGLNDGTTL